MTTSVQLLINEGLARVGWADEPAKRARFLAALNESERFIPAPGSFIYLTRKYPLTIANTASSVGMPTGVDYGKAMSLRIVGQPGYLKYVPADRFMVSAIATYYDVGEDYPAVWTVMRDASGTMTIYVDPANSSGGNLTFELTAQQAVADLVDTTSSFSLLPDGYEWTLLLRRAEAQIRRQLSRPDWKAVQDEADELLQIFYTAQRTSKAWSATDAEAVSRKRDDVELAPEA
jgi:hypothetical protein